MTALKSSNARDVQFVAALALGMVGDRGKAVVFADGLKSRFSQDTIVQFNYLPAIYAQIALFDGSDERAAELPREPVVGQANRREPRPRVRFTPVQP